MTNPTTGSSARLDLIADLHRSDSTGNCTECHARRWPCDTFRHATGTTEPRTQRVLPPTAAQTHPRRCPHCTHPANEHTRTIGGTGQCHHDTGPWADNCRCTWNRRPQPQTGGVVRARGQRETAVIYDEALTFADHHSRFNVGDHITPAHMQALIDRLTPPPGEPAIPIHRAERNHWVTTTRGINANDWITRYRNHQT